MPASVFTCRTASFMDTEPSPPGCAAASGKVCELLPVHVAYEYDSLANTKGHSSTYLAMGFANVRAGTLYPPEH